MKSLTLLLSLLFALPAFGATCKISEYSTITSDFAGRAVPVAVEPAANVVTE